jgi:lycopene cyclase domain-containing protein
MSYFGFLLQFVVVPILILAALTLYDGRQGRTLPDRLRFLSPWLALGVLVVIAVVYTTPWDNYLVASRVWWYNPALVTGITLGWVPIEEYTFFMLQPVLSGLWLLFLARRLPARDVFVPQRRVRAASVGVAGLIWLGSVYLLLWGPASATYLALILVWALPPILLQLAVGADILWHYRRLIVPGIGVATLYLCVADALAIQSGTWTINPEQSLNLLLGGVLPVEEALFFLMTNILLGFGLTLAIARATAQRLPTGLRGSIAKQSRELAS